MDEKEQKYLEGLKKQIDPEVLRKMADYLGGEQGRGSRVVYDSSSAIERLIEKKAAVSQAKVKQRKIETDTGTMFPREKVPVKIKGCMIVYSSTGIWSRIMQNIFNPMGFQKIHGIDVFKDLVYYLLKNCYGKESACSIAVNVRDIPKFIIAWENLKRGEFDPGLYLFFDRIKYFCVIETPEQVMPALQELIGDNRLLYIKDPAEVNQKKVLRVLGIGNK